jgi:NAD-dependent SIR2 family protein deacetylase
LNKKDILQYNFTQNIDNLESRTALDMEKVIQCHGANIGAQCAKCKIEHDEKVLKKNISKQKVMRCKEVLKEEVCQ